MVETDGVYTTLWFPSAISAEIHVLSPFRNAILFKENKIAINLKTLQVLKSLVSCGAFPSHFFELQFLVIVTIFPIIMEK